MIPKELSFDVQIPSTVTLPASPTQSYFYGLTLTLRLANAQLKVSSSITFNLGDTQLNFPVYVN
jgi:hypothetical protein